MGLVLDAWIGKRERKVMRETLTTTWLALAEANPAVIALFPLLIANRLLERTQKSKMFSWRTFRAVAVISICQLIISLGTIGIIAGVPFSMEKPPWQTFDYSWEKIDSAVHDFVKAATKPQDTEIIKQLWDKAKTYRTYQNRLAHTVACWSVMIILNALGVWLSFGMSRRLLAEMLRAPTRVMFTALLLTTFVISWMGLILVPTILMVISIPMLWPALIILLILLKTAFFYIGFPALNLIWFFCWVLCPLWIRVCAFTVAMPALVLFWLAITSVALRLISRHVHRGLLKLLDRMLQSEKGEIIFVTTLLGALSAVIGIFLHS